MWHVEPGSRKTKYYYYYHYYSFFKSVKSAQKNRRLLGYRYNIKPTKQVSQLLIFYTSNQQGATHQQNVSSVQLSCTNVLTGSIHQYVAVCCSTHMWPHVFVLLLNSWVHDHPPVVFPGETETLSWLVASAPSCYTDTLKSGQESSRRTLPVSYVLYSDEWFSTWRRPTRLYFLYV